MKWLPALALLLCTALAASRTDYLNVKRKFQAIEKYQAKPGSRIPLPASELNAYVQTEMVDYAAAGLRNPSVELRGNNIAVGKAMIDFLKLQSARGATPNWLLKKMLEGEREVVVTARVTSGNGTATVFLERVEVGGIPMEGATLDFLIKNYFTPRYPAAKINQPFELNYKMDRLEVGPGIAYVVMQK